MSNKALFCLFWVAILSLGGFIAGLGFLAAESRTPVYRLVILTIVANIPYALALVIAWKCRSLNILALMPILLALGFRLLLVASPPVFSDDIYRYVWDGRVLVHGTNPYRYAPDAEELASLRNHFWSPINNPSLRTIYPPVAELLFGAVSAVAPHPTAFKFLSALADTGVVIILMMLVCDKLRFFNTAELISSPEYSKAILAGMAYGLNPLAMVESGMSGHLEPIALLTVLLSFYFLKQKRWFNAALLVNIGIGIKLLPVLLYPTIAKKRLFAWLMLPLSLFIIYLPFVMTSSDSGNVVETLGAFARRWEGNGSIFALFEWTIRELLLLTYGVVDANAVVHVPLLDDIALLLHGTFFSLHMDSPLLTAAPGTFVLHDLSLAITKITLGAMLALLTIAAFIKEMAPLKAAKLILGVFVLFTPVLHPWYFLWVLPFAILSFDWPWLVLSATLPLAYLPLDRWWSAGEWLQNPWIPWVEYGLFFVALVTSFMVKTIKNLRA